MRDILSEYGLLMCSVIGGMFAFGIYVFISTHYKQFSRDFIWCITGCYVGYDAEVTIEELEEGWF